MGVSNFGDWLGLSAVLFLTVVVGACGDDRGRYADGMSDREAPAATGDPEAMEIADATLEALGGREAWDQTRSLAWDYLGRRQYLWAKWDGRVKVRFEQGGRPVVVSWRTADRLGKAWIDGQPVSESQTVHELVDTAHENWINDSYWLVMPYKLLDPGVVLSYDGRGEALDGRPADRLVLTFEGVGLTPRNRFVVHVGVESRLVEQWDVYGDRDDTRPSLRLPWRDWREYGSILLSGDRGERKLTGIAVYESVPDDAFERPESHVGGELGARSTRAVSGAACPA